MNTVPDIVDAFGGTAAFARALDLGVSTASEMKRRKSIPVRYWPDLVAIGRSKGVRGLSYKTLVQAHVCDRETQVSA